MLRQALRQRLADAAQGATPDPLPRDSTMGALCAEAHNVIERHPLLMAHLAEQCAPIVAWPTVAAPGMKLSPNETMLYRAGQDSVLRYLHQLALTHTRSQTDGG